MSQVFPLHIWSLTSDDVIISASTTKYISENHKGNDTLLYTAVVLSFLRFQAFWCYHTFSIWRTPFSNSLGVGLLGKILFPLSEDVFIFPSYFHCFAGIKICHCSMSSSTWKMFCPFFLASIISDELPTLTQIAPP